MASERQNKMSEEVRKHAAMFIESESTSQSLITVTRADISPDFKNATIFFTTIPESQQATALAFLKRKRKELKEYLKNRLQTRIIPFVDIAIDEGERNRQRIDEILFHDKDSN